MNVKRFDAECSGMHPIDSVEGEYCLHSDYAALEKERDEWWAMEVQQ